MEIEIKLNDGMVVRYTLPGGTVLSSTQLRVFVTRAQEGRSGDLMVD